MAADELRRRVDHEVGAERQRLLQQRRGERVVDDHARPGLARRGADGGDVGGLEQRVGGRLQPQQVGLERALRPTLRCRPARSARRASRGRARRPRRCRRPPGSSRRGSRGARRSAAGAGSPPPRPCRRRTRPRGRPRARRSRSRRRPRSRCPRCGCTGARCRARSSTPGPAACSAARRASRRGRRRWPTSPASKQPELLVGGLVGHEHQLRRFDDGLGLGLRLRRRLFGRGLGQQVGDPREVRAQGGEHRRRI